MQKQITCLILFLLMVFVMNATTVFSETFNTTTPPAGWSIQGYHTGGSHQGVGTAKTNAQLFPSEGSPSYNYLRLTENEGYQRTWAYYTTSKLAMKGTWTITMEVRIGGNATGADGLCLIFADPSSFTTPGVFDLASVEGGWGEFEGTPHGVQLTDPSYLVNAKGYHANFKGFSLEFDHYQNNPELFREYIHWVDLATWTHTGLGSDNFLTDPSFYYNNGWQRVKIAAQNGVIKFIYGWNGTIYTESFTMDTNSPGLGRSMYAYDAYLGIGAATGGEGAYHDVRNFKLEDVYDETLPVVLSSFNVTQNSRNQGQVNWTTQSETNIHGFSIVRNTEPELQSAQIVSPLIDGTNTSEPKYYQYNDSSLNEDGTYYYWLQVSEYDGEVNYHGPIHLNYAVNHNSTSPGVPVNTGMSAIFPNPFNPSATIDYTLLKDADVLFTIYDLKGRVVRTIDVNHKKAGDWNIIWNGTDDNGTTCPSGAYFVKMQAGNVIDIRKAVLMK